MDDQQGPAAEHRGLRSVLCGGLDGRGIGESGHVCVCVCVAEALHHAPEAITALLVSRLHPSTKEKDFTK